MAGREEFRADFVVGKNEITEEAEKAAKAVDKLEGKDVEVKFKGDTSQVTRDIDDVLAKVDKLAGTGAAEILLTTNATQIANQILDLVTDIEKLDASDPTVDVKADNIATLEAGLDRLSAKAKEITSTPINIDTRSSVAGIDDIGRSANSSKSVLANMVGNATQDLGALGGIAGSAGVAIGQMGEYMVDARADGDKLGNVLKNFAGVAGPIAAIALGVQLVSEAMKGMKTEDAFNAALVEDFNEALREGQTIISEIRDTATETGQVLFESGAFGGGGFAGLGSQSRDLIAMLRELGFTADEVYTILGDPRGSAARMLANIDSLGKGNLVLNTLVRESANGLNQYADAQDQATLSEKNRLEIVGAATRAEADYTAQLEHQAGMLAQHSADIDKATAARVKNVEATVEAIGELGATIDEIRSILSEPITIGDIVDSVKSVSDEVFALKNISMDYEAALDDMNTALDENGKSFDLATEKGRANEAALQALGGTLIPEIAANYERAGGSLQDFGTMMADTASRLKQGLIDNGVSAKQAQQIVDRLIPLDDVSIQTQFELLGADVAAAKVEQLIPLLASLELSPDILKEVAVAIAAGKGPEEILAIIQTALTAVPPEVSVEVSAPGAVEATARIYETDVAARALSDAETVETSAPGAEEATTRLYETDVAARALSDTETVETSAPGATTATTQLAETDRVARALSNMETVETSAPGATTAQGQLEDVETAARNIPGSRGVTVSAEDNASGVLESIKDAIAAIRSKTVTITAQYIPIGGSLLAKGSKSSQPGDIAGEAGPELLEFKSGRQAIVNEPTMLPGGVEVTPLGAHRGSMNGAGGAGGVGGGVGGIVMNLSVNVAAPYGSNPVEWARHVSQAMLDEIQLNGPGKYRRALGLAPVA